MPIPGATEVRVRWSRGQVTGPVGGRKGAEGRWWESGELTRWESPFFFRIPTVTDSAFPIDSFGAPPPPPSCNPTRIVTIHTIVLHIIMFVTEAAGADNDHFTIPAAS